MYVCIVLQRYLLKLACPSHLWFGQNVFARNLICGGSANVHQHVSSSLALHIQVLTNGMHLPYNHFYFCRGVRMASGSLFAVCGVLAVLCENGLLGCSSGNQGGVHQWCSSVGVCHHHLECLRKCDNSHCHGGFDGMHTLRPSGHPIHPGVSLSLTWTRKWISQPYTSVLCIKHGSQVRFHIFWWVLCHEIWVNM